MKLEAEVQDIPAIKRKYLEERDKRVRPDGISQYRAVDLDDEEFGRDPFNPETPAREPVRKSVEVVIVGAGHAGLLTAISLVENEVSDFLIIEKAADFGGTWYWNRYPDCRCDIESYIYMPYLEEGDQMPTEKYARSREIRANASRIGRKFGLYERALLHTGVRKMAWDADASCWMIETDVGDQISARFVCLGSGPMSRPKLPGIPGIETFKGKTFHTSRWDYTYTGGDETGGLEKLKDKNVAIVGTGATACQVIPRLADSAGHLYVVQRTPAAVTDRRNRPTDPSWWSTMTGKWWRERATNFSEITVGVNDGKDQINDTWTEMFDLFNKAAETFSEDAANHGVSPVEYVDHKIMVQIRKQIDERVKDPATAEALKPYYNFFCKRPLFLDGYYETFNKPNVTLIDTKGRGLDSVIEHGIVFEGREYPVDCIIFASGFEVAVPLDRAGGLELTGKDGATLKDRWAEGMTSLHGMLVNGFPNICFIGGVRHAAFSWNVTYNLKLQADHFAYLITEAERRGAKTFEVTQSAEDKWLEELKSKSAVDAKFLSECTPGYLNNEGADVATGIASQGYGAGVIAYRDRLAEWRENGVSEDLVFTN